MGGQRTAALQRWGAIPLRLIVGYGFMAHGVAKIVNGPERFGDILHALGVPAPHFMGWATIVVELVGGLAVLAGAFVPLVSLPLGAVLAVAALTVHLPYGFSSIKLQAVTAAGACLATLALIGTGPFAVDGVRARRRAPRTAA